MLDFLSSKAGIVAVALVTMFVLERLFPMTLVRNSVERLFKNFMLAGINFILGPLVVLPLTAFAAQHVLGLRPAWWNMALDLLVLDLWIYAWHRLNHVVPFLWRFHEVHHLDEALDTSTGLRFHFGEVALSACVRAVLIWLLSIPLSSVVIFESLIVVTALFQHSNIKLPAGVEKLLSYFLVTPSIHWVHHHALRRDIDSNYATMLSVWDLVFGSRSPNPREVDMVIGVEGRHDLSLVWLVLRPFWRE
jgi:sterol desaturase/sphingolipid hydroxylase (fatty acid hydroxylase superfamily)